MSKNFPLRFCFLVENFTFAWRSPIKSRFLFCLRTSIGGAIIYVFIRVLVMWVNFLKIGIEHKVSFEV